MSKFISIKKLFLTVFFLSTVSLLQAQTFTAVKQIGKRRMPWLVPSLQFRQIEKENGNDVFELYTSGKKIVIAATDANAAAMGLGWYIKYYCNRSMSHLGDNLSKPQQVLPLKNKVRIVSPFQYRYALNYCTISYSMAFYNWKDWERELDWMALNGVNLLLAPVGTEAVWYNTLQKLGYDDEEARKFIAHPTYTAWWLMGNLEGEGGLVSKTLIEQQKILQQKILQRMKVLAINPILQGFYGMIPTTLKTKMKLNVVEQGRWAGGYQRPDFLLPTDSSFKKIAGIYYNEMQKLYGKDIFFFGGEPFHEGGKTGGVDVSKAANIIQKTMQEFYPKSTWVLQGWQHNPSTALLKDLDKSKTLVIELFGENTANWETRRGYENTPFVWCNVTNFGEKTGIYSKLQRFADEVYRAKNSQYSEYVKGIGIIPEGINNNPVNFALMFELGWHKNKIEVADWIKGYTKYRYGKTNNDIEKAWQLLLQTAYSSPQERQEGPAESIFCARPTLQNRPVSSWGTRKRNYDTEQFTEAVRLFVKADKEFKNVATYQTDKIDFLRQVLANKGEEFYTQILQSVKGKNIPQYKKQSAAFLKLMLMQDSLLSANNMFRLDRWLQQAASFGQNEADKKQALRNAKTQITIWGPEDNPKTDLHEYAHKEWSGLLSSLYYKRWQLFFDNELKKLNGQSTNDISFFEMDKKWINEVSLHQTKAINDVQLQQLIKSILFKN